MTLLVALMLASSIALGLAFMSSRPRSSARQRLIRLADGSRVPNPSTGEASLIDEPVSAWLPAWLMRVFGRLAPRALTAESPATDRLRKRLIEAGYRRPAAVSAFMGGRMALGLGIPLLVTLVPGIWRLDQLQLVVLLLVATACGFILPSYWVDRQRSRRQLAIEHGLPDALDLMVVCVQAGLGLVASLHRVIRDLSRTHPILAAEFELTIYEIRVGKSTADGLRALAERTGVSEISALVAMLVQTERFGTNISDTLRVHADALRTRRMQRAEELANKAPLKMLFPTTLIFFSTLVVSLGPAMVKILKFFAEH